LTTWTLNAIGTLATTIGALLVLLYLYRSPRLAKDWQTPEGQRAYASHRRLLIWGAALISAWLVLQYVALLVT
jgi:nitroreductase